MEVKITEYHDFFEWDKNLETGEETLKIDGELITPDHPLWEEFYA